MNNINYFVVFHDGPFIGVLDESAGDVELAAMIDSLTTSDQKTDCA